MADSPESRKSVSGVPTPGTDWRRAISGIFMSLNGDEPPPPPFDPGGNVNRRAVSGIVTPGTDWRRVAAGIYPFSSLSETPDELPTTSGPWDFTVNNQLAGVYGLIPGLDVRHAAPYLDEFGEVYPPSFARFQQAAAYDGLSMLSWSPELRPAYTTGTIEVAAGVVTLTGGTFPVYGGLVYPDRLYIDGHADWYAVASRDSDTQLTLINTSINQAAGTAYKFTSWDYRELDPELAVNDAEWQQAHDEFAFALVKMQEAGLADTARIGYYELGVQFLNRDDDIIGDAPGTGPADYANWQAQASTTANYETASGFKLLDFLRERNGRLCWSTYVDEAYLASPEDRARWLARNQHIMETLAALDIPNAAIFKPTTLQGNPVPDDFMTEMLDQVQAFQPYEWGVWALDDEVTDDFRYFIANYLLSLVTGPPPTSEDGYLYGGDPLLLYARGVRQPLYSFRMPDGLCAAPCIVNRLAAPGVVWFEGIDYVLNFELGLIQFVRNPFEEEFSQRYVYRDNDDNDVEAGLWLFGAKFDQDFIADHHGYVLGVRMPSSENYRDFLNSLYDGLVEGGHYRALSSAIAAVVDAPLVKEPVETVHAVSRDHRGRFVVTDKHVYRFHDDAEITVAYGDVLYQGDPMCDAAIIHEFHDGFAPDGFDALTLGKSFLPSSLRDGLTFENKLVDVIVSEDDGVRQARFEIGGWPADVQEFWETVEAEGAAAGETFADLLAAQPGGIPKKINPLKFLTANVLRNNVFLVELRPASFGSNALPLKSLRFLRRLIPPNTAMIVLARLEAADEPIIMDGPGDEDVPGYEEVLAPFIAGEPLLDTLSTSSVVESTQLSYVDGICV